MNPAFTTQKRWDESYVGLKLEIAPPQDAVRTWIEQWVAPGQGDCLELGCFPGRYLAVLGELGYELNGVDLTPRVESDLPDWLGQQGYRLGNFCRADIFQHDFRRQYDVVCSFGLVEHFGQWAELIQAHARLVKPKGLLLVATPNFRGWAQRLLHEWLDRANLAEHNLEAMQPAQWSAQVAAMGFSVLSCGWFGRVDFWSNPDPNRSLVKRAALRGVRKMLPVLRWLPEGFASYSPYCGLAARKCL